MLRRACAWAAIALLLVRLGFASAHPAQACTLRVGWTAYAIYTFAGVDGQVRGIDAELITAAAEGAGCTVQFRELPWARILLELRSGGLDVTSSASRTPEREIYALFSQPYRQADMSVWVRRGEAGRFPLQRLADVQSARLRLGVVVGYAYGPEYAALARDPGFAAWIDGANGYETNITKLLHGRIDGFLVDDSGVMVGWVKKLGVEGLVARHPLALPGEDLHFMFSRASVSPERVAAIDASLVRMHAEGRAQQIIAAYME